MPPTSDEFGESDFPFYFLGESYLPDQKSNNEEVEEFFRKLGIAEAKYEAAKGVSSEEAESVSSIIKDTPSTVEGDDGEDFESYEVDCSVKDSDIVNLLKRAANHHYEACFEEIVDQDIYLKCSALLKSEYVCKNMDNLGGAISWNYPKTIPIPVAIKLNDPDSSNESIFEGSDMRMFIENFDEYCALSEEVSYARCRSRFPVPVILFRTKYICRSGTLANRKVAVFEAAMKSSRHESTPVFRGYTRLFLTSVCSGVADFYKKVKNAVTLALYGVDDVKEKDARILELLEVHDICDLMVENRKSHTGIYVSSSEKINIGKYGKFGCLRIPYPGCEFFRKYSEIKSSPVYEDEKQKLVFDWKSPEVDSVLGFAEEEPLPYLEMGWESYTKWDLVTLTKNYLKLLLYILDKGEGSILVHCISGWDRTPLFISLLRISLWADSLIHRELDCHQMAYFTLGYDWYLFGHNLPSRLRKNEEIMHFLFKFLPEIASEEFSILGDSELKPKLLEHRRSSIETLSKLILDNYEENTLIEDPPVSDDDEPVVIEMTDV